MLWNVALPVKPCPKGPVIMTTDRQKAYTALISVAFSRYLAAGMLNDADAYGIGDGWAGRQHYTCRKLCGGCYVISATETL